MNDGSIDDYPHPFDRPANSVLSAARLRTDPAADTVPAPGPVWTNGLAPAAHPAPPACPAFCQNSPHSTNPAGITRTHRATLLELDGHDGDDIEVPITVALERIDHRASAGWETGQQAVILTVGTAFYAPPDVRLTRAEAVQVGMAFISGTAVMG